MTLPPEVYAVAKAHADEDLALLRRLVAEGKVIRRADRTTVKFEAIVNPPSARALSAAATIVPKSKRRHRR